MQGCSNSPLSPTSSSSAPSHLVGDAVALAQRERGQARQAGHIAQPSVLHLPAEGEVQLGERGGQALQRLVLQPDVPACGCRGGRRKQSCERGGGVGRGCVVRVRRAAAAGSGGQRWLQRGMPGRPSAAMAMGAACFGSQLTSQGSAPPALAERPAGARRQPSCAGSRSRPARAAGDSAAPPRPPWRHWCPRTRLRHPRAGSGAALKAPPAHAVGHPQLGGAG